MDILKLLTDYNIQFANDGERHYREGWVNLKCPFCSGPNPGNHLGYDLTGNKFVCWRCGGHYTPKVISELISVPISEAFKIITQYGGGFARKTNKQIIKEKFRMPSNMKKLIRCKKHVTYLEKRGFDPVELVKKYGLKATKLYSIVEYKGKELDLKQRIVIPYYWNNELISFDTRDVTNTAIKDKYKGCPDVLEIIPRKKVLYGRFDKRKSTGLCVEGTTDVWRLGKHAFATSGVRYTQQQVREMCKLYDRIFILYDPEKFAQKQAQKLKGELEFRNVEAHVFTLETDPGNLSQKEANYIVKQLVK